MQVLLLSFTAFQRTLDTSGVPLALPNNKWDLFLRDLWDLDYRLCGLVCSDNQSRVFSKSHLMQEIMQERCLH